MRNIYHIPAPDMKDEQIALVRVSGFEIITLSLPPITYKTTVSHLVEGLIIQIDSDHPVLLGFCYGGLLAQEVAQTLASASVIGVSCISSRSEIPMTHRFLAKTFYLLPALVVVVGGGVFGFLLNTVLRLPVKLPRIWRNVAQNKLIVKHALAFEGPDRSRVFRIHGSCDRVIPLRDTSVERVIDGGGHFMFFQNKHKEVLAAIREAIIRKADPEMSQEPRSFSDG